MSEKYVYHVFSEKNQCDILSLPLYTIYSSIHINIYFFNFAGAHPHSERFLTTNYNSISQALVYTRLYRPRYRCRYRPEVRYSCMCVTSCR